MTGSDDPAGPNNPAPLTAAVVAEIVDEMARLPELFLTGDRAQTDLATVLDGYRWMFSILSVGLETFVWGDTSHPRFTDIVGFNRKWGGDNADAYYQYAPIDPDRTYCITAHAGDAVYFSLTVYGGPDDGRYSERIVGSINDRDVTPDGDGRFQVWLGAEDPGFRPWLKLEPDAVAAITRDYLAEPATGRRMEWTIEAMGPDTPWQPTDESEARRFRAALTWLREQAQMVPVVLADPNTVAEPYPVPAQTFGWAAGDAAYAMGSYELAEDQALVIRGSSPDCAFWNMCLWNPFLHTFNYDHDRVTINGEQVAYEPDGSWEIVVSERDPAHPNWVSTQHHRHGLIWFRWFLPDATPERPTTEVITLD